MGLCGKHDYAFLMQIFLLIFRDGVSEGQFYQVLLYELDAIREVTFPLVGHILFPESYWRTFLTFSSFCKACASLEPNYQPPVTFVVVQKRHHTRLFASNYNDKRAVDRSGNILPGKLAVIRLYSLQEYQITCY